MNNPVSEKEIAFGAAHLFIKESPETDGSPRNGSNVLEKK